MKIRPLYLYAAIPLLASCSEVVGCAFSDKTQTTVASALEKIANVRPYVGASTASHHGGSPKLSFSIGFEGAPDNASVLEIRNAARASIEKPCHSETPPIEITSSFSPSQKD